MKTLVVEFVATVVVAGKLFGLDDVEVSEVLVAGRKRKGK